MKSSPQRQSMRDSAPWGDVLVAISTSDVPSKKTFCAALPNGAADCAFTVAFFTGQAAGTYCHRLMLLFASLRKITARIQEGHYTLRTHALRLGGTLRLRTAAGVEKGGVR